MRRWRIWLLPSLVLLLAYVAGFIWFLRRAEDRPALPAHADAVVVLTGGPGRIETGLRLLVEDRAPIALISGLGRGVTEAELARRAGLEAGKLAGRIALGRQATSTHTNAEETALFVAEHKVHALILVTAAYHMPRALVELGRAVPDVALYPAPVVPEDGNARAPGWRQWVEEYSKWLLALAGFSRYGPARGASTG